MSTAFSRRILYSGRQGLPGPPGYAVPLAANSLFGNLTNASAVPGPVSQSAAKAFLGYRTEAEVDAAIDGALDDWIVTWDSIEAGALPLDRLPSVVGRKDQAGTWSQAQTFSGTATFNSTVGIENTSPLAKLHVGSGTYNPSGDTAVLISRNIVNSGSLFDAHGFVDVPIINRSGGMGYASLDSRPSWTGSNNYDHALTLQSFPVFGSAGTMTNFNGMIHGLTVNGGTVTNSYGIELRDATGTGTVTTQYGLYVASMTKAATNWAIYVAGTTPSYIGGPVGIGRTAPAAGLAVEGEVVVGSTKPITISGATGLVTHKGTAGGYLLGASFKGSGNTAFGDFGVVGTSDTLGYFYIGPYGDELATFSSSGNGVKGGVWHLGGGNQRVFYLANGSTYYKGHGSLPHIWYDSSDTTRMYLDSSGNLTATGSVSVGSGTPMTKVLSATATLDFPSIATNDTHTLTITVTGAAAGDSVCLGIPAGLDAGLIFCASVTAADTVTIRMHNSTGGSVDPASATFRATVIKF